jgi:hypothetical protein
MVYTGYTNKGEFIETVAKIIISHKALHWACEEGHVGCEIYDIL